jgi:PAS domain S-box-containing protein
MYVFILLIQILVANEMACELFGYEETELIGMMLKDLVRLKPREQATIMESHLEPSGQVVNLTGKVVRVFLKESGAFVA